MKLQVIIFILSLSAYSVQAKPPVEGESQLDKLVGITYQDKESAVFLKEVLSVMNIKFRVTETSKGQLIEWKYLSESQFQEISNRVSQYGFIKNTCKGMKLPSPKDNAKSELSCEN